MNKVYEKRYNVIDPETGEIINHIEQGDQLMKAPKELNDEKVISWNCGMFVKGNVKELQLLIPELSSSQRGLLFSLMAYVNYKDCLVCYPNGKDINLNSLTTITNVNIKTVRKITSELIKLNLVYSGKNGNNNQYFVNPWVICRGNYINKTLKAMFKNYQIRSMEIIRWKDLK